MSDPFPAQSHKSRESREIQPVTTSPGRRRPEPAGRRLMGTIFQGDARSVWTSMIWDTFFPSLSDNIKDAIHNGVDALFGGYSTGSRRTGRFASTNYRNSAIRRHDPDRALGGRNEPQSRYSPEDRRNHNTSVIEIDSRVEAQEVLNQLNLLIDQFDQASMADFLRLVDISPEHTDFGFGWEDLGNAHVVSSKGSYYLDLPTPIRLPNK